MTHNEIIQRTIDYVKQTLVGDGTASTGHDWWHIERVWKNAIAIGKSEQSDLYVVQLGALLHDIADWKFHGGDDTLGPKQARAWLESLDIESDIVAQVEAVVEGVTFKGSAEASKAQSLEAMVVQDADRLDALGAIGIARAFAYGGYKNRDIYNPDVKPELNQTAAQYKQNNGHTINHFYEKLLLLKDRMNTPTAQAMAAERHQFMEQFLEHFYREWEGQA